MSLSRPLLWVHLAIISFVGCGPGVTIEPEDLAGPPDEPGHFASVRQSIVGGTIASPGEYPFMAAIDMIGFPWASECGGTLVTPTLVLTAGHCVFNSTRTGLSQPADFRVILGRNRLSNTASGELRNVSQVILHPFYQPSTQQYDVAFLRLSMASTQPTIEVASPYGPSDRILWVAGVNATTIGWGATYSGSGSGSDDLREVVVPILDDAMVSRGDWYGSSFDPATMVAAGFEAGGYDSCQGDSGGPLLVPSQNGWKQVGVTSWGVGCARRKSPGVYTRVSAQRVYRWVKAVIHETPHVGDVNGDGRADIVTFTHGDPTAGPLDVHVALSNGASFGPSSLWADWWAHRLHIPLLGDFNGDGRDDIFAFTEMGDAWVALSNGSSFNGGAFQSPVIMDMDDVPMVGDVTGDGRDDIVIFAADSSMDVFVVPSTGSGFGPRTQWHGGFGLTGESFGVADVNADGRDDIIAFNQGVNGENAWVARSTGSAFGSSSAWHNRFAIAEEMPGTGDFDGDGDEDVLTFTRNAGADVYVGLSNRTSGFTAFRWHDNFGGPRGTYRTGDVNGDGRADIIHFVQDSTGNVFVSLSSGAGFGPSALWRDNAGCSVHDKCVTGAKLHPSCGSVVSQVCAADSYCCNTYWDGLCVKEVQSVGNSLACSASQGTCGHPLCAQGSSLAPGCDAPPASTSCVSEICAVDPYCCSTAWDSLCVGRVSSVCGKNCN